jgi:hypothetical protein
MSKSLPVSTLLAMITSTGLSNNRTTITYKKQKWCTGSGKDNFADATKIRRVAEGIAATLG